VRCWKRSTWACAVPVLWAQTRPKPYRHFRCLTFRF